MSKSGSTSLNDIGGDVREIARAAAREAGMSVGDWLDALVSRHAAPIDSRGTGASIEQLRRAAALMAQPARSEVHRHILTGTDRAGVGRDDEGDMAGQRSASPDALRGSTALQAMSERLALFEQGRWMQDLSSTRTGRGATPRGHGDDGDLSRRSAVRQAAAAITARQAALDDDFSRSRGESATASIPAAADLQNLGDAVAALEAKLYGRSDPEGEAAPSAMPRRFRDARPVPAVPSMPPPPSAGSAEATRDAFEALARDLKTSIARLDERDGRSDEAPRPIAAPVEDATWAEIRSLIDKFRPGSTLDAIGRRIETLSERLEERTGAPAATSALLEGLSRRVEDMHAVLKGAAPAADIRSLEAIVSGVARRIEQTRDSSAELHNLEAMVRRLSDKVDAGRSSVDRQVMSALEVQIGKLGERLERSEASLLSLDAVERSLSELFNQIEQTRHAAVDAAEAAARTAAKDTLRAAMQQSPIGQAQDGALRLVEKVGQDVAQLRVAHDFAEQRTHASLTGLHLAMETLLGRLNALDEVVGSAEPPASITLTPDAPVEPARAEVPPPPSPAPTRAAEPGAAEQPARRVPVRPVAAEVDPLDSLIEPRTEPRRPEPRRAEPGSGKAPDITFETRASRGEPGRPDGVGEASTVPAAKGTNSLASTSFIAAARRAAQASAAATAARTVAKPAGGPDKRAASPFSPTRTFAQAKAYLAQRRRPMLLGLAALVLLVGALEVVQVGVLGGSTDSATVVASAPADLVKSKADGASTEPAAQEVAPLATEASPAAADQASGPAADQAREPAVQPPGKPVEAAAKLPEMASLGTPGASTAKPVRSANPFLTGLTLGSDTLPDGLRRLAGSGDAAAQYEIGTRLADGRGAPRDPKAAAGWFEKAAAQGLVPALYRLGSAYEKGVGETRDAATAMIYYGKAAEAGNVRAMHNLAVMSAEGAGGKPDYAKAANWFGKAATFGVRDSQFNLAILYARGLGIEQNLVKSYTWFAIAAGQGDEDAAKKRDEVAARLDAGTLSTAKATVEAFRPTTPSSAANEVAPPPGGWDAAAPAKPAAAGRSTPVRSDGRSLVM